MVVSKGTTGALRNRRRESLVAPAQPTDLLFEERNQLQAMIAHCEHALKAGDGKLLPGNVSFLQDGRVLCRERDRGDSRYPYGRDGFNFWVSALGHMHGNSGLYHLFLPSQDGEEPAIAFFAGCDASGNGSFVSHSLMPVPFVREGEASVNNRFTIIGHDATYFVTATDQLSSLVRVFVDQTQAGETRIYFSVYLESLIDKPLPIYVSTYMNPFCRHQFGETSEDRWFKEISVKRRMCDDSRNDGGSAKRLSLPSFVVRINEDVSRFQTITNFALLRRSVTLRDASDCSELSLRSRSDDSSEDRSTNGTTTVNVQETTSRLAYAGSPRRGLASATFLATGKLSNTVSPTVFNENAIVGDMLRLTLPPRTYFRTDYVLSIPETPEKLEREQQLSMSAAEADDSLQRVRQEATDRGDLRMEFCVPQWPDLPSQSFNCFVPYLKKQVAVCAMIRGYMSSSPFSLIGFRDVFQAIEGHLFDQPHEARSKILEALGYVLVDGRCPRQYSLPVKGVPGKADLREYIDQGCWAISAIFTYLSVTGDMSLLDERVGYHRISTSNSGGIKPTDEQGTVLEHLLRIVDYLGRQRDPETGLVLALYGDWNDALDGLGISTDPSLQFGTGVSVMTSLQLYRNYAEIIEILSRVANDRATQLITRYRQLRDELRQSLQTHAVVKEGQKQRIVHGWGDHRKYYVGSFRDCDGLARDGLTSNAYWVLSGMLSEEPSLRDVVLNAFERLDSRFGFKTFHPGFARDTTGVGRIAKLPLGTAENGAVYIHATTFAIAALFQMGEPKKAWQQIAKILPFTSQHRELSHSPFVMPNSYVDNPDLNLTGQSMNDWQTGCSNVLLKLLIRYVFGFQPTMERLHVGPANWSPFDAFDFSATAHGRRVRIMYARGPVESRAIELDGETVVPLASPNVPGLFEAVIPYDEIREDGTSEIVIIDPPR